MPQIPLIMPQLGESIAEATVVKVLVRIGDLVAADQDVMEVETNKATMNVASPCQGLVQALQVEAGQSYPVGAVLGRLDVSTEEAIRAGLQMDASPESAAKNAENGTEHGSPGRQATGSVQ